KLSILYNSRSTLGGLVSRLNYATKPFNGTNLWLMKSSAGTGELAGKASRLSLWNDLRSRERKLQLNKPKINYDE
ncbi:hypothetical protein P3449_18375, partial [Vibrio parahaemolyticus]|nr:hypothetical protein [Vibrio parahaemolyticus]MDF4273945.1 hypothetical protein [Vibrio parahaemolyticus]MDF4298537.1 hypothetical protein [Vibrio parahaemolyticus]